MSWAWRFIRPESPIRRLSHRWGLCRDAGVIVVQPMHSFGDNTPRSRTSTSQSASTAKQLQNYFGLHRDTKHHFFWFSPVNLMAFVVNLLLLRQEKLTYLELLLSAFLLRGSSQMHHLPPALYIIFLLLAVPFKGSFPLYQMPINLVTANICL